MGGDGFASGLVAHVDFVQQRDRRLLTQCRANAPLPQLLNGCYCSLGRVLRQGLPELAIRDVQQFEAGQAPHGVWDGP